MSSNNLNVLVSSKSVMASLRVHKHVYAKVAATDGSVNIIPGAWYRIDRYRIVDRGRSTARAMARTLSAYPRWFQVDGQNVEVR